MTLPMVYAVYDDVKGETWNVFSTRGAAVAAADVLNERGDTTRYTVWNWPVLETHEIFESSSTY